MDTANNERRKKAVMGNHVEMSLKPKVRTIKESKKKRKASPVELASVSKDAPTKKQKHSQPLKGVKLSVSTLKDGSNTKSGDEATTAAEGPSGYQEVCQICKDLGAQVTNQVSKRIQLLLCTKSAVGKSTQRVRKALKRKIPIVDVAWLESCRLEGVSVDKGPFLLDEQAKESLAVRDKNVDDVVEQAEVDPDAGWTEGVSFGCSCVCHENGVEKDCPWCSKGCSS
jgi:hypothetical protein